MNETAARILRQLETRRALLLSLDTSGKYAAHDPEHNLYHGRVDGAFALVPIEHADHMNVSTIQTIRWRGLEAYVKGVHMVSLTEAVAEALFDIETLYAWVKECGSIAPAGPLLEEGGHAVN